VLATRTATAATAAMARSLRVGLAAVPLLIGCGDRSEAPSARVAAPAPEPPVSDAPAPDAPSADALSADALARVSPAGLRADVERLAHDRLRGRPTPSPELDEAAAYLRERLRAAGLEAPDGAPEHLQRFECGGPRHPGLASNVAALLPGRDPTLAAQTVLVSAHYDHIGTRDFGEGVDGTFNGANDNASGIAAMLAIAEALAAAAPRRSVLFVAFCGEERGLLGSHHFAAQPLRPLDGMVAHVNLEMLGRPRPDQPPTVWIPGMARSQLGSWLADANASTGVRFVDALEIGPEEGDAFDRSDNYPLALGGVVAHTVSTGVLDDLYHSPRDESGTLDYERMAVLVQAIARGVHRLAERDGQPQWLDPPR
jgi:hypothetical protein